MGKTLEVIQHKCCIFCKCTLSENIQKYQKVCRTLRFNREGKKKKKKNKRTWSKVFKNREGNEEDRGTRGKRETKAVYSTMRPDPLCTLIELLSLWGLQMSSSWTAFPFLSGTGSTGVMIWTSQKPQRVSTSTNLHQVRPPLLQYWWFSKHPRSRLSWNTNTRICAKQWRPAKAPPPFHGAQSQSPAASRPPGGGKIILAVISSLNDWFCISERRQAVPEKSN